MNGDVGQDHVLLRGADYPGNPMPRRASLPRDVLLAPPGPTRQDLAIEWFIRQARSVTLPYTEPQPGTAPSEFLRGAGTVALHIEDLLAELEKVT